MGFTLVQRGPTEEPHAPAPSHPVEPVSASSASAATPSVANDTSTGCIEALAELGGNSQLMAEEKQLAVGSFIKAQGSPLEQELLADLAGIRPDLGNALDNGLPVALFWKYGAPRPSETNSFTADEQRRIENLLGAAWAEAARLPKTMLAAHLIREHGDAPSALQMLDGVLPIGPYELVVAIEIGWAPADFQALFEASNANIEASWYNGANLAKVAAAHLRPDILRFLMSRGADPTTDLWWGHGSVLDDIVSMRIAALASTPATRSEQHQKEDVFADVARQLIAAGDRPYLPSTLSALNTWLPGTPMPTLHPNAAALLTPSMAATAETVAALDAEWNEKVEAAERLERRCETMMVESIEHGTSAFHGTDLAAKQRYQEVLERREARRFDELATVQRGESKEDEAPRDGPATQTREALLQAVLERRWSDAVVIADQEGRLALVFVLTIALQSDAPLDVLVALIDRTGGAVPPDALRSLAQNRRPDAAQIAEALERYGLDPHAVDAEGRNGFTFIAGTYFEREGAWRFAEYLANHAVTVKPSAHGLDPLDTVLLRLLDLPSVSRASIPFVRFLIDQGAPIEPSHLQLAKSISKADAETYRRLVRVVPELAS